MSDCRFGVSPVNYPDPDPEVLVNFGTEAGPACWEVCHCEG